jgi:hypothetical protein
MRSSGRSKRRAFAKKRPRDESEPADFIQARCGEGRRSAPVIPSGYRHVVPGRNRPCPCGSTIKYKKCCLAKDEAAQRALAPPPQPGSRIIHHRGRPLLVPGGRDLPAGVLDRAVDFYAAKARGEGPAAQLMRFVQPLLEGYGDDAQLEKGLNLGAVFWNLALAEDDEREELLAEMLVKLPNERDAVVLRALANDMVKRHQAMFPEMHR